MAITGSSGLIGTAVRRSYERDGHDVVRLVRREPHAPGEVRWHPTVPAPGLLDGACVVVNLAGADLGAKRWTPAYRELILSSRIDAAEAVAVAAANAPRPPSVLLCASGIRYYGIDRGEEVLTESASPGPSGLLPAVARAWEAATAPASDAGIRVCHLRLGLVLSRHGGVLARLLPWFRRGLGASFASGREFWSFVSLTDTVRAIRFLAMHPDARGPYNITAPHPVRNRELTKALARAVSRPAVLRVPGWALRIAFGQIASEVFGGLRVVPARLADLGFRYEHADIDAALRDALAQ